MPGMHFHKKNKHNELSVYQAAASNEDIGSLPLETAYYGCMSRDVTSFVNFS